MHLTISHYLSLPAGEPNTRDELLDRINYLIINDFELLVSLLYRMDVSEYKINDLLKHFPQQHAAEILLTLMEEREAEKVLSRQQYKTGHTDGANDAGLEKW